MKKILLFLLLSNLALIFGLPNPGPIIPSPIITPPIIPTPPPALTPTMTPPMAPSMVTPTMMPPTPKLIQTPIMMPPAPTLVQAPTMTPTQVQAPVMMSPAKGVTMPAQIVTTQTKTKQQKDDLATINIKNLSNQTATITEGTATINNIKNQKILINAVIQPNQKNYETITIYNYISENNTGGQEFNNLTSLTIGLDENPANLQNLLFANPINQSDTIHIDFINNKWIAKKETPSSKETVQKETIIKPTTKAFLNNIDKNKTPKSFATKTAQSVTAKTFQPIAIKTTKTSTVTPMPRKPKQLLKKHL